MLSHNLLSFARLLYFLERTLIVFRHFFLKLLRQTYFVKTCVCSIIIFIYFFLIVQRILLAELLSDQHLILFVYSKQLLLVYNGFWCIHNPTNILWYNLHLGPLLVNNIFMLYIFLDHNLYWNKSAQSVKYYKVWFEKISILVCRIFTLTFCFKFVPIHLSFKSFAKKFWQFLETILVIYWLMIMIIVIGLCTTKTWWKSTARRWWRWSKRRKRIKNLNSKQTINQNFRIVRTKKNSKWIIQTKVRNQKISISTLTTQ